MDWVRGDDIDVCGWRWAAARLRGAMLKPKDKKRHEVKVFGFSSLLYPVLFQNSADLQCIHRARDPRIIHYWVTKWTAYSCPFTEPNQMATKIKRNWICSLVGRCIGGVHVVVFGLDVDYELLPVKGTKQVSLRLSLLIVWCCWCGE